MADEPLTADENPPVSGSALLGVGCVTSVAGFFGGGMIAVMVGKVVGQVRGCVPLEGTPSCDWHLYVLFGGILGLILLPTISIIRLKGRRS